MGRRQKVSLTLDSSVLEMVDREAESQPLSNRSRVVEKALRFWITSRRKQELDRSIEDYYKSLSDDEMREDSSWAKLGDDTIRDLWDDEA